MGISKTEGFTKSQNQLANLMKAIGHPARVAIIEYLLKQKTCICKDIVDELPLSQPTISQHLRELKKVGLIQGTITGNRVCYCLDKKGFQQISKFCGEIFSQLDKSNCC